MLPIRVTIHPEDVPAGYEAEAVYGVPEPREIAMTERGIQIVPSQGRHHVGLRLVLTPKRKSLAQRIKDSGWQCQLWAVHIDCKGSASGGAHWSVRTTEGDYMPLRPDHLLDSIAITEDDYGVVVKIDHDGYPIVEDEQ